MIVSLFHTNALNISSSSNNSSPLPRYRLPTLDAMIRSIQLVTLKLHLTWLVTGQASNSGGKTDYRFLKPEIPVDPVMKPARYAHDPLLHNLPAGITV